MNTDGGVLVVGCWTRESYFAVRVNPDNADIPDSTGLRRASGAGDLNHHFVEDTVLHRLMR